MRSIGSVVLLVVCQMGWAGSLSMFELKHGSPIDKIAQNYLPIKLDGSETEGGDSVGTGDSGVRFSEPYYAGSIAFDKDKRHFQIFDRDGKRLPLEMPRNEFEEFQKEFRFTDGKLCGQIALEPSPRGGLLLTDYEFLPCEPDVLSGDGFL